MHFFFFLPAWLAKPIAQPTSSLPEISIARSAAQAVSAIPAQKSRPEKTKEDLRPNLLVEVLATSSVVRSAARKAEEVKRVSRCVGAIWGS